MKYRKLGMILTGLLVAGTLVACSGNDTEKKSDSGTKVEESEETEDEEKAEDSENAEPVQDEKKTEDLLTEEGITAGQVYTQGDTVVTTMIADSEANEEKVKELAEKYAEELKKEYPDMKVNVQAVKDGENIANIIKE